MKKLTRWIVAVLAAALLAGSLSGCGAVGPMVQLFSQAITDAKQEQKETSVLYETTQEQTEETEIAQETESAQETTNVTETETETETAASLPESTIEHSDKLPEYEHYDPAAFYENLEQMRKYAEEGSAEEVNTFYDKLYDEALKVMDLRLVVSINADENASDKNWQAEKEYTQEVLLDVVDAFCVACQDILKTKDAAAFKEHLNDEELVDYYENYIAATDELKELYVQQTSLISEYYEVMDQLDDITYDYNGTTYRFGDILEEDNNLSSTNRTAYLNVFEGCYQQLNEQAGEIFLKLVKIRDQIAKLSGYDNYNDYCDDYLYHRNYSASDLEKMKTAARSFGSEYQEYLYYTYQQLPDYKVSSDQLVEDAKNCVAGISPLVDKAYQYLIENKLYSIGDEKSRIDGAFTSKFEQPDVPFIFAKTNNTAYDLVTIIHESGHFTDFYFNDNPYPLFDDGQLDLQEIPSTGLQLLAGDKLEKILGEDAYVVNAFNVLNLISYVTDGCIYDEWQRTIYENPDMTLDEINDLFRKVSDEYGVSDYTGQKYSWVEVGHNFEAPLYYISYATSAFASLQIWLMSRTDYTGAVDTYEKILNAGGYGDDYMTVLKNAGLKTFDDSQTVYEILSDTFSYVRRMMFGMAY